MTLSERFAALDDWKLKVPFKDEYDMVTNRLHARDDINAFLLLHELQPSTGRMIDCAEHDQIWLCIDIEKLNEVLTDEQLKNLVLCGVFYDNEVDSLSMFI